MKNNFLKRFIVGALLLFLVFASAQFMSQDVWASSKVFSISPMSQRMILIPGETYRGAFVVANPSDSTDIFQYEVSVAPFFMETKDSSSEEYDADLVSITSYNAIVDWVTIDNPAGFVSPNENKTISFSINVPLDAPSGGQYFAFLVRDGSERVGGENQASIKEVMQMAHVVYSEVAGETRKTAEIVENSIPSFVLTNPLRASSVVDNTGNIHADTQYVLQVWPLFSDEEICTNEEKPGYDMIMPETQKLHFEECNLPPVGIFRAKQIVKIFGEESVVEKMIIVCPIWLLFIILFVVLMVIFWLFTRSKARKSSKKAKTAE